MAVRAEVSKMNGEDVLTISVSGRLDINSYKEFTQAYKEGPKTTAKYLINMAELEYVDSSALGMLLMLRECASGKQAQVVIVNCSPGVMKILKMANFDKLFAVN